MRVHIIGGSGAGKSYISNKLKEVYNLELVELDKIEWENKDGKSSKRKDKDKIKLLKKELLKDNVLLEGVYYKKWCEESFKKCDYIFFLETPLYKQQYRILRRSIRRKLGIEKGHVKETLKSIKDLFIWNIKYNTVYKKEIMSELEKYKDKVYKIKEYNDILNIIGE